MTWKSADQGTIDGQGAAWWAAYATNSGLARPLLLQLYSCNRLFIHDITFQNPPYHHCGVRDNGGNITISNLTERAPSTSPNTDGLDFVGTNCVIENCHISVGDDNIAMGASGPLNDLLITNCTFGSGHGVSIGSSISVGVSNLTVINCTFNGNQNGIRIKCDMDNSAPVQNLNYFNLTMTNVNLPIVIYSHYNDTGTPDNITPAEVLAASNTAPVNATTPVWRDITISNLTVASSPVIGGIIWGPTEMPISNLTLVCITNTAPKTFDLYNVKGVQIIDSQFTFASGNTFTLCNAGVTISNTVPTSRVVTIGGATSANSLALYNTIASMSSANLFAANPFTISSSVLTDTADLTLPNSTVQNFVLGTNSSTVAVTGNLTLNSTLNITNGSGFTATNYTLFAYTGSLSGQPALGATPTSFAGYGLDTSTAGLVNLVVSSVPDALQVVPASVFAVSFPVGEPIGVFTQNYTLINTSGSSFNWSLVNTSPWLNASPTNGTLAGGGQTTVTVSLNATVAGFPVGNYAATIFFKDLNTGIWQDRQFTLQVLPPLVLNGGFETGDFTSWNLSGNTTNTYVSGSPTFVHSGNYAARLGPVGSLGYLSETVPTIPGEPYMLSFWLENPDGGLPNEFSLSWNGNVIYDQTNLPAFTWTNLQFAVQATGSSSVVQFGARNDPQYFDLDDVSLTGTPLPAFQLLSASGNGLAFSWNAVPGSVYQLQYNTNLLQTNWINLGGALTAADTTLSVTNLMGPDPQRFYRLQVLQ